MSSVRPARRRIGRRARTIPATERADGRRRAQDAEARRPDVEHVLREDRQQRDGAAEEDGEEIERDRAEEHRRRRTRRTPPSTLARSGRRPRRRPSRPTAAPARASSGEREHAATRVDELGLDREEQAAERRAADHGELEARPTAARARATSIDCGTSDGGERARRRRAERRRDAGAEGEREERPASRRRPTRVTASRPTATAASSATESARIVRRGYRSARWPAGKREQRQREEHREPDDPEVERVAVDLVDLPADRDERHLDRDRGRHGGARRRARSRGDGGVSRTPAAGRRDRLRGLGRVVGPDARRGQELDLEPLDPRAARLEHAEGRPSSTTSSPTSAARPRWPNTKPATVWKSSSRARAELLVEVVDRERAVDPDRRLAHPLDRLVWEVELVLDVADDLLEQVLERDDARRRAVLVDDDRHVLVRPPELREQRAEVLRLGHDVRRPERAPRSRPRRARVVERRDESADVEDPDDRRRATPGRPGSG